MRFTTPLLIPLATAVLLAQDPPPPPLQVSARHLALGHAVGATARSTATFSWIARDPALAVSASASTMGGGDWLGVEQITSPARTFRVFSDIKGLGEGSYTGFITLTAEGIDPVEIEVTLTVYRPNTTNQIVALSRLDLQWGEIATVEVSRAGPLTGLTKVELTSTDDIICENLQLPAATATATATARFQVTVFGGAAEGERWLRLKGDNAETNWVKVYIRRGNPYLASWAPAVLQPGRLYGARLGKDPLNGDGMDLGGMDQFRTDPDDGLFQAYSLGASRTSLSGWVLVADNASPGPRTLTFGGPAGTVTANVEVQPVPATAPLISDASVTSGVSRGNAVYDGRFRFRDADGDLKASSMVLRLMLLSRSATTATASVVQASATGSGSFTVTGETEGEIRFSVSISLLFGLYVQATGDLRVALAVVDGAGNVSNTVILNQTSWVYSPF